MRKFLIGAIMLCALGVWLTFEAEAIQEEVAMCNSETPTEYYQRRCRMEVYDDYKAGTAFLALTTYYRSSYEKWKI